jgi:hypothetical protein
MEVKGTYSHANPDAATVRNNAAISDLSLIRHVSFPGPTAAVNLAA